MSDNLKVAKECGADVVVDADWYECASGEIVFYNEAQLEAYTSRILASQQAAHEAEIAKWIALSQANEQVAALAQKRADKAERACAMKDEALKDIARGQLQVPDFEKYAVRVASDALSASPQQVSEWEAKNLDPLRAAARFWQDRAGEFSDELEPLRTQVAMLRSLLNKLEYNEFGAKRYPREEDVDAALTNTQATADQFIAECEQRGAVKALEDAAIWFEKNYSGGNVPAKYIRKMIRATSKKAG